MEDRIIELVVGKDEVTWKSMLISLVNAEGMNPWDVDVSILTQKYISMLAKLKDLDFRVSGKMVLAAALLLRMKTRKLVGEDIVELERLMSPGETAVDEEGFYDELEQGSRPAEGTDYPQLMPRTPQPRKRKVSIYDLMGALQQALEVKDRRILRRPVINIRMPERKVDISKLIVGMYDRIMVIMADEKKAFFSQLVSSENKGEKILAFISLLYLANHDNRKIDLIQAEHFGDIEIVLVTKTL